MIVEQAPLLFGSLVTLRPYRAGFSEEELGALYRWARDPELLALSGGATVDVPYRRFRELFLAQLPRHNSAREQLFAVLNEHGRLIGRTGLFGLDSREHAAELGIVIGERDHWGRAYGREAVGLLVGFGFHELGLERILLYTFDDNLRAQRAFAAVGFRPVRRLSRFSFERGTHVEIEMELLKTDDGTFQRH